MDEDIDDLCATVLERLLALPAEAWSREIDAACAARPALAGELRARLRSLLDTGLLAAAPGGAPATAASQRFGHYVVLGKLGSGGQGTVFLAADTRLGRRVALKVLASGALSSDRARQRLQREAATLSRLDHPGLCTIYEVGETEGSPWLAMRYVEGEPLSQSIARTAQEPAAGQPRSVELPDSSSSSGSGQRPAPSPPSRGQAIARAALLVERAARALHVAHMAGVVHRDIKPGNIMVTAGGDPVLLDFGFARDSDSDDLTRTGDLLGTPAYMSPEQLAAKRIELDRRTDVYSLGVTLYECLTLARPFAAESREALYQAILTKPAPRPRLLNPAIPPDLEVIVEKALEKDRDRRYATALDLADDLRAWIESRPIAARRVSAIGRLTRFAKREPAKAMLVAVLLLALPTIAALSAWLVTRQPLVEMARLEQRRQAIETALSRGYAELAESRFEPTLAAFAAALAEDGASVEAIAGQVLVHLARRDANAAVAVLDRHSALADRTPPLQRLRTQARARAGSTPPGPAGETPKAPAPSALDSFVAGEQALRAAIEGDRQQAAVAVRELEHAVLLAPRPRQLYSFELARAAGHAHDERVARAVADALEVHWPDSAEAWLRIGVVLSEFDLTRATAAFRSALRLDENLHQARIALGVALYLSEDLDGAIAALRAGLEHMPENGTGWTALGVALSDKPDLPAAAQAFRRALAAEPDNQQAHRALALVLEQQGDHAALRQLHESWVAGHEQSADAWQALAAHLVSDDLPETSRDDTRALVAARRAVDLAPSPSPDRLATLAEALFRSGKPGEAADTERRALALLEANPPAEGGVRRRMRQALQRYEAAAGK